MAVWKLKPQATPKVGIYLDIEASAGSAERLAAALASARVDAVLIRPTAGEGGPGLVRQLCLIAQAKGAAALIFADVRLAAVSGADGVHLPWRAEIEDDFAAARRQVGASGIVGAEAGELRHDAMVLAEAGADYIAFTPRVVGRPIADDDRARLMETADWWAEIFEVPGVVLGVVDAEDAAVLAQSGIDFIGWRIAAGQTVGDVAENVSRLAQRLASSHDAVRHSEKRSRP